MMFNKVRERLQEEGEISLQVSVRPGASKTQVKGQLDDGTWKIDVAAVPEDGKANVELVKFLAKELDVATSQVEIVSGQTGRKKVIRISV